MLGLAQLRLMLMPSIHSAYQSIQNTRQVKVVSETIHPAYVQIHSVQINFELSCSSIMHVGE